MSVVEAKKHLKYVMWKGWDYVSKFRFSFEAQIYMQNSMANVEKWREKT